MLKSIRLGLALVIAALFTTSVHADTWPTQTVRFVVPTPAGSSVDIVARLVAEKLGGMLGQTVIVDNKGGAGGTIGLAQFVNGSKGDGSATMVGGMVMVGAIATNKSPVNLSQVTPLARLTGEQLVVVVPASSKIQTLKELIDQFKANPGTVSWGAARPAARTTSSRA